MGKWTMLWGRVEKNKKNLLGGSLTVALPWEGEGVPLPTVSPATCQKHTQAPFVYVMNVTHKNETHTRHIEAYQEAPKHTSLS